MNWLASVAVTTPATDITVNKGVVTVDAANDFADDQKFVLTAVHSNGTSASKTLTVSGAVDIAQITIGDVTTDETKKDIFVSTDLSTKDYWLPITVLDQYGNEITDSATLDANITRISSNANIVNTGGALVFDNDADNNAILKLANGAATATHGTATITLVSTSGVTASKQVTVLKNAEVDVFTIATPDVVIKQGVEFKLPFEAFDQYGEKLVSDEDLATLSGATTSAVTINGVSISVSGGTIDFGVDYAKDNARTIKVTPGGSAKNLVFTVVTPTGKVQNLTMSVQDAPKVVEISGLDKDFYKLMQQTLTQTLDFDDVKLKDQYGDSIDLPSNWYIEVAADDGTFDKVTRDAVTGDGVGEGFAATLTMNAVLATADADEAGTDAERVTSLTFTAAAKGTEVIKLTLKNASNVVVDEFKFTMETVELKDISSFGIEEVKTVYTGGDATGIPAEFVTANYNRDIKIFGVKGGQNVLVNQGLVVGTGITGGLTITGNDTIVAPTTKIDTKDADKTATLTVVVEAGDKTHNLTQAVKYNSETPLPVSIVARDRGENATISAPSFVTNEAALTGKNIGPASGSKTDFEFRIRDQYGVNYTTGITYVVTNKDLSNGADVSVANATGIVTISVGAPEAGDSFVVTVITSNGLTSSLKVIFGVDQ